MRRVARWATCAAGARATSHQRLVDSSSATPHLAPSCSCGWSPAATRARRRRVRLCAASARLEHAAHEDHCPQTQPSDGCVERLGLRPRYQSWADTCARKRTSRLRAGGAPVVNRGGRARRAARQAGQGDGRRGAQRLQANSFSSRRGRSPRVSFSGLGPAGRAPHLQSRVRPGARRRYRALAGAQGEHQRTAALLAAPPAWHERA